MAVFLTLVSPALSFAVAAVGVAVGATLIAQNVEAVKNKGDPKNKIINIKNKHEEKQINNGDSFSLGYNPNPALNANSMLYLDIEVTELDINNLSIKVKMENGDPNAYALINGYFRFYLNDSGKFSPIDENYYLTTSSKLVKGLYKIKIEKYNNLREGENRMFIHFETKDEGVIINGSVLKNFKIYIE